MIRKHSAIAAIHAGWRGTVAYIVRDNFVWRMEKEFGTSGEDVVACDRSVVSHWRSFESGLRKCT